MENCYLCHNQEVTDPRADVRLRHLNHGLIISQMSPHLPCLTVTLHLQDVLSVLPLFPLDSVPNSGLAQHQSGLGHVYVAETFPASAI